VSVKGSQDGSWGLTQSFKSSRQYHDAVDVWLQRQSTDTLFCLVQFLGIEPLQMPRMYLAWPHEIAQRLKDTACGRGDTILYENKSWGPRAHACGTTDRIPETWLFTQQRLMQVLSVQMAMLSRCRQ
jgi:hypothetical protein